MIPADAVVRRASEHGFALYSGVPCSCLAPLIHCLAERDGVRYVPAANEGDAVAVVAGAELAGLRGVAMFQNSGLGNAINPLTSLTHTFDIPVLLLVTHRGRPGKAKDEPQHELMGTVTGPMLDLIGVRWSHFPAEETYLAGAFERAVHHLERVEKPFALLIPPDAIAPWPTAADTPPTRPAPVRGPVPVEGWPPPADVFFQRAEMIAAIQGSTLDRDVILATTGFIGRELFTAGDRANQFYMVGSMGCAASIGLGIALAQRDRRVIVIDGDGAVLMRMGVLAAVGHLRPENLVHVVLDNRVYESTGGQPTATSATDLAGVARACGYPRVVCLTTPPQLGGELRQRRPGPTFVHVPIRPGGRAGLLRPGLSPAEVARRLRRFLSDGRATP